MSPERPPAPEINEELFQEAYLAGMEKFSYFSSQSVEAVKNFILEVAKRNRQSQNTGEENYLPKNIAKTIYQFKIDRTGAKAYRFVTASYFGRLGNLVKEGIVEEEDQQLLQAEIIKQENLIEAKKLELIDELGEEEAEKILRELE